MEKPDLWPNRQRFRELCDEERSSLGMAAEHYWVYLGGVIGLAPRSARAQGGTPATGTEDPRTQGRCSDQATQCGTSYLAAGTDRQAAGVGTGASAVHRPSANPVLAAFFRVVSITHYR